MTLKHLSLTQAVCRLHRAFLKMNVTSLYQLGRKLLFQRLEEKKKEKVTKKKANDLNKEGEVLELKAFDVKWFPQSGPYSLLTE